jgi:hypothetical protein
MFSWGLWHSAMVMTGATVLTGTATVAGAGLAGPAQLTGLLGGFALAVAGLLALDRRGAGPA